jgi:hypothetical protein
MNHETNEPQLSPRERMFVKLAPWATFAIILTIVTVLA